MEYKCGLLNIGSVFFFFSFFGFLIVHFLMCLLCYIIIMNLFD